jgi:hypothetical protein
VTESGLVLELKPAAGNLCWCIVPEWTETSSLPQFVRMLDGGFAKLTLRSEDTMLGAQVPPGPRVLWFSGIRAANGHTLGRWFGIIRNDNNGLRMAMRDVFYCKQELAAACPQEHWPNEFRTLTTLSSFLNSGLALSKPIVLDVGTGHFCFRIADQKLTTM